MFGITFGLGDNTPQYFPEMTYEIKLSEDIITTYVTEDTIKTVVYEDNIVVLFDGI